MTVILPITHPSRFEDLVAKMVEGFGANPSIEDLYLEIEDSAEVIEDMSERSLRPTEQEVLQIARAINAAADRLLTAMGNPPLPDPD